MTAGSDEDDVTVPVRQARGGIRGWVREAGRRTGAGLWSATPYGIVALLAASAVAPVAGVALGASGEFAAALGQLGGVGSNYLADSLYTTARRMRGDSPSAEEWRDAVAGELLARLESGDERAIALRDEIAALLRAVDAVDVALRAADTRTQQSLAMAFGALGRDVGLLHGLATDAARVLAALQQQLAEQGRTQHVHTDLLRQSLVAVAQLRQDLISHAPPAADDPVGAVTAEDTGAAPYPGLASFQTSDSRYFHGRETLVAELLGRLSEQVAGGPPVVVIGVSGVGKSSLLRAGVLPAVAGGGLGADSAGWPWLIMTPGENPLAELTGRTAALAGADPATALAAVRESPAAFGPLTATAGRDGRLVIVVDQFEELFTRCPDPAERAVFAEALAAAAPALLLIAVRADFYPQCTELAALVPMLAGQIVVGPLRTDELRRAVRDPATDAGLTIEPGLEELLLSDLGALAGPPGETRAMYEPGALPLLAHALRATWARRAGATMTVDGYRQTGGIARAVAATAERIYLGLAPADRAALRSALLSLVTVVDDRTVRRRATRDEADTRVLRPMVEARLVTAGRDTVEISHDALLTSWPRLTGWLTEAREEILLRQRLAQAATEWAEAGEDRDSLYRGARLAAAREWAADRTDLPEVQHRFLAAAATAAEAELIAQRRTSRRLRRLVAGLAVVLLLAVAGGLVAVGQWRESQVRGRESRSRQLAAESRTEQQTDTLSAAGKALEAWRTAHTMEARSALLSAPLATTMIGRLGTATSANRVAVSPDGRLVAVGYYSGTVQLWDSSTLQRVGDEFRMPGGNLMSLRFSPDGRFLAGGALATDGVAIWDVPGGRLRTRLPGLGAVAWLPDSSAVVAARSGRHPAGRPVGAWTPDGKLAASIAAKTIAMLDVDIRRDGAYLALVGVAATEIVRRHDGRTIALLPPALAAAFAPDGTLVNVGRFGAVTRWDPSTGKLLTNLRPPQFTEVASPSVAITPDGTVLVQAKRPGEILELTLDGGSRTPLTEVPGAAFGLALSADGHLLAVVGNRAAPTLFRLGTNRLPHPQEVGYLAYNATGDRLATGSSDPVVRIWDPRTSALLAKIPLPSAEAPLGLAFAPDGGLAVRLHEHTMQILTPGGTARALLRVGPGLAAATPAFSPDGTLFAMGVVPYDDDGDAIQNAPGIADVIVYDARTLQPKARLETPGDSLISLTFTRDGRHLIAGANHSRGGDDVAFTGPLQDGSVWQWSSADLRLEAHRVLPGIAVSQVQVSPDNRLVAVAASSNRVELLRVDGLKLAGSIAPHPYGLRTLAFSPDGRTLATGTESDTLVRLWDTASGERVAELRGHLNQVDAIEFAPDGRTLATSSGDWTVALWHLDPDDAVRRLCAIVVPNARAGGSAAPELCR